MRYLEMKEAFTEAKQTLSAADAHADLMAEMLVGRLRKVSPYYLKKLKAEIEMFNMKTRQWKN